MPVALRVRQMQFVVTIERAARPTHFPSPLRYCVQPKRDRQGLIERGKLARGEMAAVAL